MLVGWRGGGGGGKRERREEGCVRRVRRCIEGGEVRGEEERGTRYLEICSLSPSQPLGGNHTHSHTQFTPQHARVCGREGPFCCFSARGKEKK